MHSKSTFGRNKKLGIIFLLLEKMKKREREGPGEGKADLFLPYSSIWMSFCFSSLDCTNLVPSSLYDSLCLWTNDSINIPSFSIMVFQILKAVTAHSATEIWVSVTKWYQVYKLWKSCMCHVCSASNSWSHKNLSSLKKQNDLHFFLASLALLLKEHYYSKREDEGATVKLSSQLWPTGWIIKQGQSIKWNFKGDAAQTAKMEVWLARIKSNTNS